MKIKLLFYRFYCGVVQALFFSSFSHVLKCGTQLSHSLTQYYCLFIAPFYSVEEESFCQLFLLSYPPRDGKKEQKYVFQCKFGCAIEKKKVIENFFLRIYIFLL
jgi:hypothetical protein